MLAGCQTQLFGSYPSQRIGISPSICIRSKENEGQEDEGGAGENGSEEKQDGVACHGVGILEV